MKDSYTLCIFNTEEIVVVVYRKSDNFFSFLKLLKFCHSFLRSKINTKEIQPIRINLYPLTMSLSNSPFVQFQTVVLFVALWQNERYLLAVHSLPIKV